MSKDEKCVVPGCTNKQFSRGQCQSCWRTAKNDIESGRTTEAQLIKRKLMLPAKKNGRKSQSALAKVLAAAKK